jgi:hypothetical protein
MRSKIDDKLNGLFEIPSSANAIVEEGKDLLQQAEVISKKLSNIDDDFDYARKNLRDLIDRGQEAIDGIMVIAREGEHPRAYEVIGQLINTISSANKDLLELSKKYKDINDESSGHEATTQVTNNSLFVGSTAELQKMIRGDDADVIEDE